MDKATTKELLEFTLTSIKLIQNRFAKISTSDDFLTDDAGLEKLDAIAMRLQAIGEALKNLYKREEALLLQAADRIYWSEIIKTRDFISHHYVDLDAEAIYEICSHELDPLEEKLQELLHLLER